MRRPPQAWGGVVDKVGVRRLDHGRRLPTRQSARGPPGLLGLERTDRPPAASCERARMNALVDCSAAGKVVGADEVLVAEFETRLAESSALAVRVAYSVLRNRADAEDVAQEAFVRAYRRFASLRDRDRFRAWLVRMTWRLALDWKRGERRRDGREQAVARLSPPCGDAEQDAAARERHARLWAAIDALPEKFR